VKGTDQFGDTGIDGSKYFCDSYLLEKWDVGLWTRFNWLRIESSIGLLWTL
jgi:hypothetical protein